jgi:nucleoside triphosphate diphosphatase
MSSVRKHMNPDEAAFRPSRDIQNLLDIMQALRTPGSGCPWDLEQNFASIAPYTIEEAYEVAEAIERGDFIDLRDELGDLLLQVVFHAQMAREQDLFDFGGVVEAITTKLIRRHPHVFGDTKNLTPDEVKVLWGSIKAAEKADRAAARKAADLSPELAEGHLGGIPHALPGLTRAVKLQQKASTVGFDWNDTRLVLDKIREETLEIEQAVDGADPQHIQEEIGDLLFAVANLARHLHVDPEAALRGTNAKFERRFAFIEASLHDRGRTLDEANLEEMDALWDAAKAAE